MTVIIGYADGKNVWMVGDEAGSNDEFHSCVKHSKVFVCNKNILIGYTSSFRMGQILEHGTKFPAIRKGSDIYKYMCTTFADKILETFEKAKYAKISNNEAIGGTFLVGIFGRLFKVQDNFSILEYKTPFSACGCGYQYALASMEAMETLKDSFPSYENYIETALKISLKTSCRFSPFVKLHDESDIKIFKV